MAPERKLYQDLKKNTDGIIWNRIENLSLLGMPDVLVYNSSGHFFTVELKITKTNKLKFSPHQIAWHVAHPHNTFILAQALGPGSIKPFKGSQIKKLLKEGFALDACCLGLDACCLKLASC